MKGFAFGWSYWMGCLVEFPLKVYLSTNIVAHWFPNNRFDGIWITLFIVMIVTFNYFNVRRYGEIEYWLTVLKLSIIYGIIIVGMLLLMDVSTAMPLLGTSSTGDFIECSGGGNYSQCLGRQGFGCIFQYLELSG